MANSYRLEGKENQGSPSYTQKGKKLLDFPSFSNKKTVLDCDTEVRASKWETESQRIVLNCLLPQAAHVERFPAEGSSASRATPRPALVSATLLKQQEERQDKIPSSVSEYFKSA